MLGRDTLQRRAAAREYTGKFWGATLSGAGFWKRIPFRAALAPDPEGTCMSNSVNPNVTVTPVDVDEEDWWRQAVIYQIYPRSFYDSNGDGLGDIRGVTEKVPHLKQLGVDAVWLSPFYPSELADGGYDVADYRDVSPQLGDLDAFKEMVDALHEAGIKVIIDIVPNHTSDQHVWFQEALASPKGSKARDRYIFRDGVVDEDGNVSPPSDWIAVFGGSQWEQVEDGQFYLHTFAVEQPDLNWSNPEVIEEFENIIRFWSDLGVDGFRIDVAANLKKDMEMLRGPDPLPTSEELEAMPADGTHPLVDRDEVHDVYKGWREIFNQYTPARMAVAEAWVGPERRTAYATKEELGQAFNFDLLKAKFDADEFQEIIAHNLEQAKKAGSSSTWVLSNHDVVRHPTRYGLDQHEDTDDNIGHRWLLRGGEIGEVDVEQGSRRANAAIMLLLGLPGSTYIYQGEELGLHEVGDIVDEERQDPTFFLSPGEVVGRDGCRVPLPWTSDGEEGFGFGSPTPHFTQPDWYANHSVEALDEEEQSTLNLYRAALELRRDLLAEEELEWEDTSDEEVLQFVRPNGWRVIMNFGETPVDLPEGVVLLSSQPLEEGKLPAETTAWLAPEA